MRTAFERIRDRAPSAMAAAFVAYPLGYVSGVGSAPDPHRAWRIAEPPAVIEVDAGETRHIAAWLRFDLISRSFAFEAAPVREHRLWGTGR